MPTGSPDSRRSITRAAVHARRRAILAFLVLPIVFAALIGLILYPATHWPYPPGFEWMSRWTPRELFGVALTLIILYAGVSILLAWRLVRRWLWESAVYMMEAIEETTEKGTLPAFRPPADLPRLLQRLERALEKHRSASKGVKEMDGVRHAVGRLCEEIEQMGLRHFDRDFSEGRGSLAPLGDYLSDCCAELSGFLDGCKSVAVQISETMTTAQELAAVLASQAERAFVGHGEVSVGIKDFSKRVEDISRVIEGGAQAAGPEGAAGPGEALERIDVTVGRSLTSIDRMKELDENRREITSDSKRLADEATVIALNAAIEASKSGSRDLQTLAENARSLAEGSMAVSEKVETLSGRYGDAVSAAGDALEGLRSGIVEWGERLRMGESAWGGSAAEVGRLLASLRGFAASLVEKSEEMARLSEATSSQAQDARKAAEEALREVEALTRRLGAGGTDRPATHSKGEGPGPGHDTMAAEGRSSGDKD